GPLRGHPVSDLLPALRTRGHRRAVVLQPRVERAEPGGLGGDRRSAGCLRADVSAGKSPGPAVYTGDGGARIDRHRALVRSAVVQRGRLPRQRGADGWRCRLHGAHRRIRRRTRAGIVVPWKPRGSQMTLFHVASLFCALGGAVILGIVLVGHGVPAVLLGVIVGLVGGWFAGPLLVLAIFFVGFLVQQGPRAAFD